MKLACLMLLLIAMAPAAHAAPACWNLQPAQSHLAFVGDQAGAPAKGEFRHFTVSFCFDAPTATGHLRVTVDTASLETHNSRRDEVLRGPDFFAVKDHPTAVFAAGQFARGSDGRFIATGSLALKGVTHPEPVTFTWHEDARRHAVVTGQVKLDRLDFGVGTGRWGNTRWVGKDVVLTFELHFTRDEAGAQPALPSTGD